MRYFSDNKKVDFRDLEESGIYSAKLMEEIKKGNYKELKKILDENTRKDKEFMEPLLYAVKKEKDTYAIFEYYDTTLQDDIRLATDIILKEPELIKDTPVSKNKEFILSVAEINPKVVQHMSENLKQDVEFTGELCKLQDEEVIKYAAQECQMPDAVLQNRELADNKVFMMQVILQDANSLEFASEELRNDYDFIKEVTQENYEVVEYIIENKEGFGLEAVKGARDVTKQFTINDCMNIIDEMAENSDDKRYQKVKDKIKEKGIDSVYTVRWITAMVAQSDKVSPEMLKKILDYSSLTISKIQKDLTKKGEEKVSIENMQELITPQILNKLKEKAVQQGVQIDATLEKKIEGYTEFFNKYRQKLSEAKKLALEKNKQGNIEVTPTDIEQKAEAEGVTIEGTRTETRVIRKGIEEGIKEGTKEIIGE